MGGKVWCNKFYICPSSQIALITMIMLGNGHTRIKYEHDTIINHKTFSGVWLRCLPWVFEFHAGLRGQTLPNALWNASVLATSRG